jgi:NDP-sugar pyrophosphorylase family protein
MTTQIIITMAGFGQRFREAGYDLPKYRIEAHGRTLLYWSLLTLKNFFQAGASVLFIARAADQSESFIRDQVPTLGIGNWSLLELSSPTDGQATTALQAMSRIDPASPMLIYNIDTFVEPQHLPAASVRGDGWVPCFPGVGAGWSFARTVDDSDRIVEIREKQRISPHATVGLYWFRTAALYADLYRRFYADIRRLEAGERYIAPMYNQLIEDGGEVYLHRVPLAAVHPLGTPAEVQRFTAAASPTTKAAL